MKLFVYADESGTFDNTHNEWFTYGGLVCCGIEPMQEMARRYAGLEKRLRHEYDELSDLGELKAKHLSFSQRKRLYGSISIRGVHRFGVVVDQSRVFQSIYDHPHSKQRFVDYALKRAIKAGIKRAMSSDKIPPSSVEFVKVTVDEHTSATNGRYTLEESIDEELRHGAFSSDFSGYMHPPLFPGMRSRIQTHYADSRSSTLVRASDVVANWIYSAVRDRDRRPDVLASIERECIVLELP